ncbi:MAG: DNA primase [Cyclobacteriaceae bacterium]|nr:DNA primase [Cyclobacteriaceae bacterium]
MRISDDTIQEIKSQIDIIDVIGEFVNLKKSGTNYKALSPFTSEKTPSFFVSPAKDIYKCFSSGKGGDAINFIMEIEGVNYIEALQYLAKKYGIQIRETEETDEDVLVHNERESLFIVLSFAKDYFVRTLLEHPEGKSVGLSYFRERGFDDPTIKKFELGYSLDTWNAFYQEALQQKYQEDVLEKAGLIIRKEDKVYDRFRGRVLFPIHNLTGKTIAFGARILTGEKNQPKYINSPETPVYHKSQILYGIYQGRQAIRQKDNCYLVEGYTDVISMHMAGEENVVASSGTSLTDGQIAMIKRYTNNITVLFDGDEAGIKASLRGIDMILQSGLNVRAVMFPEGEDPDSYARKIGPSGFKEYLKDNTRDFISFKTALFAREAQQDPITKAKTIKEIVASIARIPDGVQRAVYIKETSVLLAIDESVLISELNKILISERQKRKSDAREPDISLIEKTAETTLDRSKSSTESIRLQEKESIRLLINYGLNEIEEEILLYEFILSELEDVEFQTPVYRTIFDTFKENLKKGHVLDADYFLKYGPEEVKKEVVDLVANPYEISVNWQNKRIFVPTEKDLLSRSVFDNIIRLKYRIVSRLIEENIEEIRELKKHDETDHLLKVNMELKKIKSELAKKLGIVVAS